MTKLFDLSAKDAKAHFLKGSSYFNGDFPNYISFEPILNDVNEVLSGGSFAQHKSSDPKLISDVNGSVAQIAREDSSRESSVVAGLHEQTDTPNLQDQELAEL